jgi:integrase
MARRGKGEGTVRRRRDGRWEARYRDVDGKRKSVFTKSQAEGIARLKAARNDRDLGLPMRSERLTTGAFLAQWIEGARTNVRASTWRRYEIIVRVQLVPYLGQVRLARMQPADLSAAYAKMLAAGLAARTVSAVHRLLGRALRDAEIAGLVARNACRLVKPPRVAATEMQTFDAEQARALLRAAEGDRLAALYHVALTSGAREGELLALRWGDLSGSAMRIARTLVRTRDGLDVSEPKTASGRRTIPLGTKAMDALRTHRVTQAMERERNGLPKASETDLVFASEVGTLIDPSNLLANSYYPLLRRAGLPRLTFHALRHTAATLMLGAGTHIRVVAERLGHADPAVTLRVYSHVVPAMQSEAAAAMDRILGA